MSDSGSKKQLLTVEQLVALRIERDLAKGITPERRAEMNKVGQEKARKLEEARAKSFVNKIKRRA